MIKPIPLKKNPFDVKEHNAEIERNLDKSADRIREDLRLTAKTWRGGSRFFFIRKKKKTRLIATNSKKYYFVNSGTKVRYATMSSDFRAKSSPSRFGSSGGSGRVLFVNKKRPRPGIKARNFDKKEVKRASKWLPKEFIIKLK